MKWEPVDVLMVAITLTICFTVATIAVSPFMDEIQNGLSESKAKLFVGIVSSLVSILSMYVGARIQRHKDMK